MKIEIDELVDRINTDFGSKIVYLLYEGASKAQRCALWARADILLITCYRDGLCLVRSIFNIKIYSNR